MFCGPSGICGEYAAAPPQPPGCWGLPVAFAVYRKWEDTGHGQKRGWAATRLSLSLPCSGSDRRLICKIGFVPLIRLARPLRPCLH